MFEFQYDEQKIGFSRLEEGDPPMGVAYGEFKPLQEFLTSSIRLERLDAETSRLEGLRCYTPNGVEVKCEPGIALLAYDLGDGETYYQVSCLGVYEPQYQVLFPHHVKAYENHFKS
jgi:hypothetical protein